MRRIDLQPSTSHWVEDENGQTFMVNVNADCTAFAINHCGALVFLVTPEAPSFPDDLEDE